MDSGLVRDRTLNFNTNESNSPLLELPEGSHSGSYDDETDPQESPDSLPKLKNKLRGKSPSKNN